MPTTDATQKESWCSPTPLLKSHFVEVDWNHRDVSHEPFVGVCFSGAIGDNEIRVRDRALEHIFNTAPTVPATANTERAAGDIADPQVGRRKRVEAKRAGNVIDVNAEAASRVASDAQVRLRVQRQRTRYHLRAIAIRVAVAAGTTHAGARACQGYSHRRVDLEAKLEGRIACLVVACDHAVVARSRRDAC